MAVLCKSDRLCQLLSSVFETRAELRSLLEPVERARTAPAPLHTQRPESHFLFVDLGELDLSTLDQVVVSYMHVFVFTFEGDASSRVCQSLLKTVPETVIGVFPAKKKKFWSSFLRNIVEQLYVLQLESVSTRKHVMKMNQELIDLRNDIKSQLEVAKKNHARIVPFRRDKIKGVEIASKYLVSPGKSTEFIDYFQSDQAIYAYMVSCNSYLFSSKMISEFQAMRFKQDLDVEDFKSFDEAMSAQKRELEVATEKEIELDLLFIRLSRKTLNVAGIVGPGFRVLSSQKGELAGNNRFEYQMKRGERICCCSPGLVQSILQRHQPERMEAELKASLKVSVPEALNSLFVLGHHKEEKLFDQSALMMEVDPHVIMEV